MSTLINFRNCYLENKLAPTPPICASPSKTTLYIYHIKDSPTVRHSVGTVVCMGQVNECVMKNFEWFMEVNKNRYTFLARYFPVVDTKYSDIKGKGAGDGVIRG